MVKRKPTVISTFAGCGGSSLGYKWAGFRELLAIDFDKHAAETFKMNFPDIPFMQRNIMEIEISEVMSLCKIKSGELDVLDGSPPCQGFSTAGKRQVYDPRNDLFKEFVRFVNGLKPKIFIMENVSGLMKGIMKGKFNEILVSLKSEGYNVKVKLMNAMWYDVPQSRERLIFVGTRKDLKIEPSFPDPTKTFITASKAIENIKPITIDNHSKSAQEIWHKVKEGGNGFVRQGKTTHFNYVKLHRQKPAPTLLKSVCYLGAGYFHWKENRSLSIEELKAICSFPQTFKLTGKFEEQFARLGNAVMPKMMYHIAKHVKKTILK